MVITSLLSTISAYGSFHKSILLLDSKENLYKLLNFCSYDSEVTQLNWTLKKKGKKKYRFIPYCTYFLMK